MRDTLTIVLLKIQDTLEFRFELIQEVPMLHFKTLGISLRQRFLVARLHGLVMSGAVVSPGTANHIPASSVALFQTKIRSD